MADVQDVFDGLAANLETISGLRVTGFDPDKVSVPAAIIGDLEIEFDRTFGRGFDQVMLKVRVLISRASDRAGQAKLNGYCAGSGPLSIKAAIESDKTLAGAAQTLQVLSVGGYGVYEVAGQAYAGAEFSVIIHVQGA